MFSPTYLQGVRQQFPTLEQTDAALATFVAGRKGEQLGELTYRIPFDSGKATFTSESEPILREGLEWGPSNGIGTNLLTLDGIARPALAASYEQLGQYDEAIASWRSLNDGQGTQHKAWLGASYLNRARLFELQGDTDKAMFFYQRLVELWEDADDYLQPDVTYARWRIDALVLAQTEEPQ